MQSSTYLFTGPELYPPKNRWCKIVGSEMESQYGWHQKFVPKSKAVLASESEGQELWQSRGCDSDMLSLLEEERKKWSQNVGRSLPHWIPVRGFKIAFPQSMQWHVEQAPQSIYESVCHSPFKVGEMVINIVPRKLISIQCILIYCVRSLDLLSLAKSF